MRHSVVAIMHLAETALALDPPNYTLRHSYVMAWVSNMNERGRSRASQYGACDILNSDPECSIRFHFEHRTYFVASTSMKLPPSSRTLAEAQHE